MKNLLDPADRAEVIARLGRLSPDSERQWGRMTPNGAMCHLTDSFIGCLGNRPLRDVSNPFSRTVMRFVGTTLPMRWPKGIQTLDTVDQEKGGTPPTEFDADRKRLVESIDAFVESLDPSTMRHPIFGHMNRGQWGRWAWRHMDHHLRQFGV